jgi:SNF2 family DNA or RNA helicase
MHQYQRNAVNLILNCPSGVLMMDVGTGKTVTLLTALKALRDSCRVYGALIVAPKRVCESVWAQETREWSHLRGQFRFTRVFGPASDRASGLLYGRDIWLINYENLQWACQFLHRNYTKQNRRLPFNMVVFDELSKMANPEAVRSRYFKELMKHSGSIERRIGMTATPATNGLTKLFGEYLAVDSGRSLGTGVTAFRHRYFIPSYDGHSWLPRAGAKEQLRDKVAPITYVARAKDLLKLTDTAVQDVLCPLSDNLWPRYRELEQEYFTQLDDGNQIEVFNAAARSNKCLQFTNGAVYEEDGTWLDVHDGKLDALEEIVEEMQGQPLLVMYPFRFDRARIKARLPQAVDVKDYRSAADLLKDWNDEKIEVLTGHPASMGHGLNLQYACSHVVWFGLVWDLELYDQGNGRVAGRQGQKNNVIIKRLVAPGTLDEAVRLALSNKASTQSDFIEAIQQYREQRIAA